MLEEVNRLQDRLVDAAACRQLSNEQHAAISMLASGRVARAFDMDREPIAVRERYGRHPFGQSLLLARRLVEAGVPVVQANMGRVQNWDTHSDNFPKLKTRLLPPLDQGVAALLDDLETRGLLEQTLVMMLGEFGRAPKITTMPGEKTVGRDHWARVFLWTLRGRRRARRTGDRQVGQNRRLSRDDSFLAGRHRRHGLSRLGHRSPNRSSRPPQPAGPAEPGRSDAELVYGRCNLIPFV